MAASGPYATDDIASEEKTGNAFHLGKRSVMSASERRRFPKSARLVRARAAPSGVAGS
jgi:hypothetical protein